MISTQTYKIFVAICLLGLKSSHASLTFDHLTAQEASNEIHVIQPAEDADTRAETLNSVFEDEELAHPSPANVEASNWVPQPETGDKKGTWYHYYFVQPIFKLLFNASDDEAVEALKPIKRFHRDRRQERSSVPESLETQLFQDDHFPPARRPNPARRGPMRHKPQELPQNLMRRIGLPATEENEIARPNSKRNSYFTTEASKNLGKIHRRPKISRRRLEDVYPAYDDLLTSDQEPLARRERQPSAGGDTETLSDSRVNTVYYQQDRGLQDPDVPIYDDLSASSSGNQLESLGKLPSTNPRPNSKCLCRCDCCSCCPCQDGGLNLMYVEK